MHLPYLISLSASALLAQSRSLGLSRRTNPDLVDSRITKRADPFFADGDFGETEDGDDKKHLLKHAINDVYHLVSTTLRHWDDDGDAIVSRWFPDNDKQRVIAAFQTIVPDPVFAPGTGGDALKSFHITPNDWLAGADGNNDLCARGADAYTSNQITSYPSGDVHWSVSHFCPAAFDEDQAPRLHDLECSDFSFGSSGRYRITDEMDALGATILHEMMHYNVIGRQTGLTEPDREGALISDIGQPGRPYDSYHLRQMYDERPDDLCIRNADNYVWFALEMYWTHKCKDKLKDQNGRFDPPQP